MSEMRAKFKINPALSIVAGLLGLTVALSLSGCNGANSADDNSSFSDSPEPPGLNESRVGLQINSATTAPDVNGYYSEDTEITVGVTAPASPSSEVLCSTTLSHKALGIDTGFEEGDTLEGCKEQRFNFDKGPGTYRLKLKVTDMSNKVVEDQKFVIVKPSELREKAYLKADFEFTVTDSLFGVFLDAGVSSQGSGGEIETFKWDVFLKEHDGDSDAPVKTVTTNALTTSVTVDRGGIYVSRLTITDVSGQSAVTEKMFKVGGTGEALIADFAVSIPAAAPVNIGVDASASVILGGVDHYEWELLAIGDDVDSTAAYKLSTESPTTVLPIVYSGIYLIRLTVIDQSGNEHENTRVITVL